MKKKVIIGLCIFSLIFLIGGIYIITTIETATSKLDDLIKLHQVEILREHLLIQIKSVQSDLSLKNTRYARGIDTIVTNVQNMERTSEACFGCHHAPNVLRSIRNLSDGIDDYKKSLSRLMTIRSNIERVEREEDRAFNIGEQLVKKVDNMIRMASSKLEEKTRSSLMEIKSTKGILYILVTIVPVLAAGLGYVFVRAITKPVHTLLDATHRLEDGNLDYRIEGLQDEFGDVAASFNRMAGALKKHMHKIEESEHRYRTLFESAGDAIFILDAEGSNEGCILSANSAAATMYGCTVEELLEYNFVTEIMTSDSGEIAKKIIPRILKGQWVKTEITQLRKDGTVLPVEISAGLIQFMDHKYILAFERDITERKRIEDTLQKAEQMKLVGEWAAGLAHEIKNSLAGIKLSVEFIGTELALTEEDDSSVFKVIAEIQRIESLLKSLLNFTRPPEPHMTVIHIHEILDGAIAFALGYPSHMIDDAKEIKVSRKYHSDIPEITTDPILLRQVFLNLMLNAIEKMNYNGVLTVHTDYNSDTDAVYISISDMGKGIDEKIISKIFDPFFTTKAKGHGLGLTISKRFIELLGGDIYAESRLGEGATFNIFLPVSQMKKEPEV